MQTIQLSQTGTGQTRWVMPNFHMAPFTVTITTQLSGSATYNIETTQDTYWNTTTAPNVYGVVTGSSTALQQILDAPVTGIRINVTAGSGTVNAQVTQAGYVNY